VRRGANAVMKNLRSTFALLIVVAVFYVGFKVVPAYFNYYQFQDSIEEEAKIQTYTTKSASEIRDSVWKKAQQLELPIASLEDLKVDKTSAGVTIETEYTVHIDVPFHPFDLKFQASSKNKQI
jgi:hypothetical protein